MKTGFRFAATVCLGCVLIPFAAAAEDQPAFKDDREKASYAIGMFYGARIKNSHMDVDIDEVVRSMKAALAGASPRLTDQEGERTITAYQQQQVHALFEKNTKAAAAFFAEQRGKPGIHVQTVNSTNEFLYKIINEGTGDVPKATDTVKINFRGTLPDGKPITGPYGYSEGIQVPVTRAPLRGMAEALQLMKAGAKWQLYLPASLAFGERSAMNVEPGSPVVIELELVSAEATPPPPAVPAPGQPITSEIIRVPSAEEAKRGAQPQIVKPEDVPKLQNNPAPATNKP